MDRDDVYRWLDTRCEYVGEMMDILDEIADPENEEGSEVFFYLNRTRTKRQVELEQQARRK